MPRFPIFRLGKEPDKPELPEMTAAAPSIALEGLTVGVDNLRHDVVLSPRFVEAARTHVMRLIVRHGELEGLISAEAPPKTQGPSWMRNAASGTPRAPVVEKVDWKPLLAELHLTALNRAKKEENISIDLLARLAVTKFLRTEMNQQFAQVLERCRVLLKNYEGIREGKAVEYRERVAAFQVRKKIILRKTGQDLFETLREIEKETLARMRRSLFGEAKFGEAKKNDAKTPDLKTSDAKTTEAKAGESGSAGLASYGLFLNRLAFSEDGRDDYLCAEHYVMLGNWDRDPDRYPHLQDIVWAFVRTLFGEEAASETIDAWICAPENAAALVGTGTPDDSTAKGVAQQSRLAKWVRLLEDEQVMECVIASYHTVPLLSQYAPRINPQQLKNALISRPECDRVERMIQEHGKLSPNSLYAAVAKVAGCRGSERAKVAARFLQDFSQYHRDLRRLETLNAALDSVNVVSTEKLRELSRMNGTLYEFLLPEEQQPEEDRVLRHVVLKADVRDSTKLTRTLMEKGLNPASYFSLNFYDPVNKLLSKYGAQKVFLEGDAIILAILERTGEPELAVSRACVLAREMIEIVRGYNELMQRSGMPELELGVGITLQEAAPLYLMDGDHQIMISEALNESDRLSSCNKRARKVMESQAGPFHVFVFQPGTATSKPDDAAKGAENHEDLVSYNLGGIRMNEAAFRKLEQEISLVPFSMKLLPSITPSDKGEYNLFSATVPVDRDIFRKIVVRKSRVPQINAEDFSVQGWTDRTYYEVCTDPAIYAALEKKKAASR
jgi:class 3 adenylate cyclase/hemoglobin-like flavoprotein